MPDPKLKIAMEDIKRVLKEHDVGAIVILSSRDKMEYLYSLSPSWSCITVQDDGFVRFRAKREDFPDREAQHKTIQLSVGLVAGFVDALRRAVSNMESLLKIIADKVEFSHWTADDNKPPQGPKP